jgi:hypothetical protein
MSLDPHLHLRRRKDGVEVITIPDDRFKQPSRGKNDFTAVRYVKSGRKGYLKDGHLECDFVVVGKLDPDQRWSSNIMKVYAGSTTIDASTAAALEDMRERDIRQVRKAILDKVFVPGDPGRHTLGELEPSASAIARLDDAIHMILAGVGCKVRISST